MTFYDLLRTSLRGLSAHKSRSLLTILGIVIGITAIILVMSVGQGAQQVILNQIRGLGTQTISIEPGRQPKGPADFAEMFSDSLKERELEAVKNTPGVVNVAPWVLVPGGAAYQGETFQANTMGMSPSIIDMLNIQPSQGVFFSQEAVKGKSKVAVIGSQVKEELFGQSQAVGSKIKLKNYSFRVVGVSAPKGNVGMLNVDKMIVVPYSTAQTYLLGIDHFQAIVAQAKDEEAIPWIVQDIKQTLRQLHNIDDPEKDDFHIQTQAEAAEQVSTITNILTALLASVAAISLVVGGIGIMNIMLVAVTERTREIGLRKAVGATNRDILIQFLLEAILLTGVGGFIGILLGAGFAFLSSIILSRVLAIGWVFTVPLLAVVLGLGVSSLVGLVFGLYPARQASQKSPIEALRYE